MKLLDLGLAFLKTDDGENAGELTRPEQSMGTVDYTAPEQWENSHGVDIRADIYSLGCTFYYLLTGMPPFAGTGDAMPNLMRQIWAHSLAPIPNARDARTDLPQKVAAVLTRMLSKKPQDRFNVPGDVATALAPHAAGSDAATYFAGGQTQIRTVAVPPLSASITAPVAELKPPRTGLSRRAVLIGAAGAIAAAAGGVAWLQYSRRGDSGGGANNGAIGPAPLAGPTIRVGVLHSLSGTMAISERSVVDDAPGDRRAQRRRRRARPTRRSRGRRWRERRCRLCQVGRAVDHQQTRRPRVRLLDEREPPHRSPDLRAARAPAVLPFSRKASSSRRTSFTPVPRRTSRFFPPSDGAQRC